MNLNIKSNCEYYQLFIRHLLAQCDNSINSCVYELGSIQFLTAIICDLYEEDSDTWKYSYNGKILHTLMKHGLSSSAIKPEMRENEQIEIFFKELIIQSYHHFSIFAKQLQHKGAKFRMLYIDIFSLF